MFVSREVAGDPSHDKGEREMQYLLLIYGQESEDIPQDTPEFGEMMAGYQAFGDSALTAAAKEGISSFQERRTPDLKATG